MTEPTDATLQQRCAEIVEWQRTGVLPGTALRAYAAEHWADHHDNLRMAERDTSARAMELIAKWGTPPAVVGQPVAPDFYTACAWHEGGGEAGWIPLPGYSNETEHGVKHLVLEAARKEGYKGTVVGRLLALGWEIRPIYLTQQPIQAQAGAVL